MRPIRIVEDQGVMGRPVYKYETKLRGSEKHELRQAKKKGYKNVRWVIRILVILLADAGKTIAETARTLGCSEQTVLNQRQRFLERRSEGSAALGGLAPLRPSGCLWSAGTRPGYGDSVRNAVETGLAVESLLDSGLAA